jgi:hypothetical protein
MMDTSQSTSHYYPFIFLSVDLERWSLHLPPILKSVLAWWRGRAQGKSATVEVVFKIPIAAAIERCDEIGLLGVWVA